MKRNNNSGISLIVLVITIIIMIILGSVIVLTLKGSNIIEKANEAKFKSDIANAKSVVTVAKAEWNLMTFDEQKSNGSFAEYANSKLAKAGFNTTENDGFVVSEKEAINIIYVDKNEDKAIIPEGFVASEADGENLISEGLVIYEGEEPVTNKNVEEARLNRNQFVWVPVEDIDDFARIDWGVHDTATVFEKNTGSYDAENNEEVAEYTALKESVGNYNGFYIARYEAGKEGTSTLVSKKEAALWLSIAWDSLWMSGQTEYKYGNWNNEGAAKVARSAYKKSKSVVSHLIYGEEWDLALKFAFDSDEIAKNSIGYGWYNDNYKSGNSAHKTGVDIPGTSLNKQNNIYDLAGNASEWTMEIYFKYNNPYRAYRSGAYCNPGDSRPAATRLGFSPNTSNSYLGFRQALYLV